MFTSLRTYDQSFHKWYDSSAKGDSKSKKKIRKKLRLEDLSHAYLSNYRDDKPREFPSTPPRTNKSYRASKKDDSNTPKSPCTPFDLNNFERCAETDRLWKPARKCRVDKEEIHSVEELTKKEVSNILHNISPSSRHVNSNLTKAQDSGDEDLEPKGRLVSLLRCANCTAPALEDIEYVTTNEVIEKIEAISLSEVKSLSDSNCVLVATLNSNKSTENTLKWIDESTRHTEEDEELIVNFSVISTNEFVNKSGIQENLLHSFGISRDEVVLEHETDSVVESAPQIIHKHVMQQINEALPSIHRTKKWKRVYSIARDGDNFSTMLDRVGDYNGTLFVIETTKGEILGGFAATPWAAGSRVFFGSGQSFLFRVDREDHDTVEIFQWTGRNAFCQLCDVEKSYLGMGGGGNFAFALEDGFTRGSTGPSATFGNPSLASNSPFDVFSFEVYAFETPRGF